MKKFVAICAFLLVSSFLLAGCDESGDGIIYDKEYEDGDYLLEENASEAAEQGDWQQEQLLDRPEYEDY